MGPPLSLHCIPDLGTDLDQLKEIMKITGTPPPEFVQKLQSAEVSGSGWWAGLGLGGWPITLFPSQAKNYMEGLPELEKKDFASVLTNASPQGTAGWGEGLRVLSEYVPSCGLA